MKGDEGSVLVVDDNEVNRDLLVRRLQRQDHRVSVAEDGFQQAYLQKSIEEQEKSDRLPGKEKTNG